MNQHKTLLIVMAVFATSACTEQTVSVLGEPFPIVVPGSDNAIGPRLSQGDDDTTLLSWMDRDEKGATLRFSRLQLNRWQAAKTVLSDPGMFVNWADLPAVTPIAADTYLAHWLSYSADAPYAYDVLTRQSSDQGATWGDVLRPHTDGTHSEHGFVSPFPAAGGTGLIWLDGRKTVNSASDDPTASGMTLRGATLTAANELQDETEVDDLICDCCQTDVAITNKGPIVVYRDRTRDEIRDIYVARHLGGHWQAGVPVSNDNWHIAGCPVNGPAIDAHGKLVAIAWFSAANDEPVVRVVVSRDSGARFSEPVVIATGKSQGRVGVVLINDQSLAVSWLEAEQDATFAINVRTMTTDGQLSLVTTVGRTGASRIVPQMTRVGDELILAWADRLGEKNKVRSVRVPILGFYDD